MSTPIETTDARFDTDVPAAGLVLVDFWASWCGPCRSFAPVFAASAQAHPDVTHLKVDVDANPQLAARHRVQSIPTTVVIRDGIVLGSVSGALAPRQLEELVGQALAVDMDEVRTQQ